MNISLAVLITVVAVALTIAVSWAYFTAQRLHRLHIRTDAALVQLQGALERRSAVAATLEPRLAELADAADSQLLVRGLFAQRAEAERALSAVIEEHLPQRPAQLVEADTRVQLAMRFYNEAVSDTRALRLRPTVKMLRLGGTVGLPDFFDLSS